MTLLSDVEAALPEEWTWRWCIWEKTRQWPKVEVTRALNELCDLGRAEKTPASKFGKACLYRRARLPQQRAA